MYILCIYGAYNSFTLMMVKIGWTCKLRIFGHLYHTYIPFQLRFDPHVCWLYSYTCSSQWFFQLHFLSKIEGFFSCIYIYTYICTHTHTTSIFVSQCITPHCWLFIPWIYPNPIPIPPRFRLYPHYTTNKMLLRSRCKSCSIPRPHSNSCPKSPLTINIPIHIPLTSYSPNRLCYPKSKSNQVLSWLINPIKYIYCIYIYIFHKP